MSRSDLYIKLIQPIILKNPYAFLPLAKTLLLILFDFLQRHYHCHHHYHQQQKQAEEEEEEDILSLSTNINEIDKFSNYTINIIRILCQIYT
eukprot:UN07055